MTTDRNRDGDRAKRPIINRRRYLAGVAAGSAAGGLGSIAVNTEIAEAVPQNYPPPNEPQYSDDVKKGWARGTFDNPVTPNTINDIQYEVLDNAGDRTDQDGPALIDPRAEPEEGKPSNDRILAFGFKFVEGSAHIYVREEPTVIGPGELPPEKKLHEEQQALKLVLDFINSEVNND